MRVPATIEEAVGSLDGIGALLTAKEWERAAIVYAFTYEGSTPGPKIDRGKTTANYSCTEFAALGITGLKSDRSVRDYRAAWQEAVNAGRLPVVKPGDVVAIPDDLEWPPLGHTSGSPDMRPVADQVEIAARILAKPEVQEHLRYERPDTLGRVVRSVDETYKPLEEKAIRERPEPRWSLNLFVRAVYDHAFTAFWILEQLKDHTLPPEDRERLIHSLEASIKLETKAIQFLKEEDVTIASDDLDAKAAIEAYEAMLTKGV